jgi:hypothetical protein
VSVGKKFKSEVMSELLENLVPGTLPHYFVILTLANFAQADGKERILKTFSYAKPDFVRATQSENNIIKKRKRSHLQVALFL